MARKSGNKTANNNELTEKSSKIGAMYKIAIGICSSGDNACEF